MAIPHSPTSAVQISATVSGNNHYSSDTAGRTGEHRVASRTKMLCAGFDPVVDERRGDHHTCRNELTAYYPVVA